MAQVRVSLEFLTDRLFGFSKHPVVVNDVRLSHGEQYVELEIEGFDVPADAERVHALCTVSTNRAGEQFHTMRFERDNPARPINSDS